MNNLYVNHVLHSLSLARTIPFTQGETVLDIGTGGGFPGIPLAIMFPGIHFSLLDATGKKIKVVENVAAELELSNVTAIHSRSESFRGRFNYVLSRAVCSFPELVELSLDKLTRGPAAPLSHGIYSLKGGDLREEISSWKDKVEIYNISDYFHEEFFKTKYIVFLPARAVSRK